MNPKIIYFGTPVEAVFPLRQLVEGGYEILCVVTSEDKPRGRGQKISPTPVKEAAQELGLKVIHTPEEVLQEIDAEVSGEVLGVVVAFGKIIKQPILDALTLVNMHFSLLPRWRGAAPVERAILAGDKKTGVCLMQLEATLDTGPIYVQAEIEIAPTHTTQTLKDDLLKLGTNLLLETLKSELPSPQAQSGEQTWAEKITSDDLKLDLALSAEELLRRIRVGGAWLEIQTPKSALLKIHQASLPDVEIKPAGAKYFEADGEIYLATHNNEILKLITLQPAGKKSMPAMDWYRGLKQD